ncbi:hypothetical protein AB0C52_28575 [Streptomyces sp. NPDC048717]|uniref:hypothetical protein n=1 Tax=Streptomyces sp. NPDC048717 TaxID=3154928 RepID=UPI003434A64B
MNGVADGSGADVGDDGELFVLTAALLTPARFPTVLGDDYPQSCAALGLEPWADGYGLVLGQDGAGARWTVVVDDVSLVAVAIASWDCGMEYDLSPDERSVVQALPGWPLAVATRAPGLPAPHDPAPEEGSPPPLTPPDGGTWGPAQRRLGADMVALRWSEWRGKMGPDGTENARAGEETPAGTDGVTGNDSPGSPGPGGTVRRVLEELGGYVEELPPAGRIRSVFGDGDARLLRADGPGWSFVARTDDMAFVLLDEAPREVLPVTRGPRLPALLEALAAMAERPI